MSEHISEDFALILSALPQDDPERRSALAHTASCVACTRLLERGASLLNLIDAQGGEVEVDPRLKAGILASIDRLEAKRSRTRLEISALALGSWLSVALALLDMRARPGLFPAHAPLCLLWQTLGVTLSLATVALLVPGWASRSSPLRLALVTMGGALSGQLWLRVRCPTHDAPLHVFAFHVSAVVFAALLGYVFARATGHP